MGDRAAEARPLLSICVPTFNRPALVRRAIQSIIDAASGDASRVELIVSDNSPDVSETACREALEAWPGRAVYLANRPDIGLTGNFNQCLEQASGRHVLFVQDDDQLLPGSLPALIEVLGVPQPGDVLLFGVHLVDQRGHLIRRQEFCRDHVVRADEAMHRLLSDNGVAWFPGIVVSREAFDAAGPFDAAFGNAMDFEMWVRLFARHGVRCLPAAISAYSIHGESATQLMGVDAEAVGRLAEVFERARATGILSDATLRRCQADYYHQFILGAAAVPLRTGDVARARTIISLFELPTVRSLGPSPAWRSLRSIFSMLVRTPAILVRPVMAVVDRLDLARRVRAAQNRGRDGIQIC